MTSEDSILGHWFSHSLLDAAGSRNFICKITLSKWKLHNNYAYRKRRSEQNFALALLKTGRIGIEFTGLVIEKGDRSRHMPIGRQDKLRGENKNI